MKKSVITLALILTSFISYSQKTDKDLLQEIEYQGYVFLERINSIYIDSSEVVEGKIVYDTISPFNLSVIPHPLDSITFLEKKSLLIKEGKKINELKYGYDFKEGFDRITENFYNCEILDDKEYIAENFIYFTIVSDNGFYYLYALFGTDKDIF